jgi:hypothetical protein
MDFSNDEILSKAPNLMQYMPEYYYNSSVTISELDSQSYEVGKLLVTLEDVEKQLYIDSATWGLEIWERVYNLTPSPTDTYEDRREVLKAKMRGQGTTTKQMLINTATAFSGGEVEIIEHSAEYYFSLKFIGAKGIPQNMAGFLAMLEDVKPAHLNYDIQYSYTVWDVIEGENMTWNNANSNSWDTIKVHA